MLLSQLNFSIESAKNQHFMSCCIPHFFFFFFLSGFSFTNIHDLQDREINTTTSRNIHYNKHFTMTEVFPGLEHILMADLKY